MDTSSNPIVMWLENAFDYVAKNRKQVVIGVAGVVILSVAIPGYLFYRTHVREQAHKALQNVLKHFDGTVGSSSYAGANTMVFASEIEKWQKTEQACVKGYADYKGTEIGPMFLAYQSEALLNLGKHDEAISVLTKAVDKIRNTAVKDFYRVKLALMLMDSGKELDKQQGLGALKMIADNAQSIANESALYYLGAYHWSEKRFSEAKNYWQMLLVKYGTKDMKHPSPYVDQVKEKLALLSVESL